MSPDYNKVYVTGYFNNGATVFDGASLTLPFVRDNDIYTVLYSYTLMVKTKTLEPGVANEPYYSGTLHWEHGLFQAAVQGGAGAYL